MILTVNGEPRENAPDNLAALWRKEKTGDPLTVPYAILGSCLHGVHVVRYH